MASAVVDADIKSFRYAGNGRNSLENVRVSVGKGETLVLFGNSGSGKSTLANCIIGICPHMVKGELKGKVVIDGTEVGKDSLPEIHKKVGIMLQNPEQQILNPRVINELVFDLENQAVEREEVQRRVNEAAKFFAIEDWLYKDTDALSQGQKQVLGLATIFANKPDVMVLDEPISMLDIHYKKQVLGYLQRLKQQKHTMVISTHDAEFAKRIADKLLVLKDGKVIHYTGKQHILSRFAVRRFMKKGIRKGANVMTAKNVSFEYEKGKEVLNNISMEIKKGEFIWLSGPNGGGKSTLAL
ncbi:ABC transporter ATP-binding protein, partial [Candidatus Woesearchaeota archaeon]|nr:ABC transporter ATP-binding protein [Candidatus Woesearchaeota archaeon]